MVFYEKMHFLLPICHPPTHTYTSIICHINKSHEIFYYMLNINTKRKFVITVHNINIGGINIMFQKKQRIKNKT